MEGEEIRTQTHTEGRPQGSKQPSPGQGGRRQKKPTLLTPWSGTSSPQNCEKMSICCLSPRSVVLCTTNTPKPTCTPQCTDNSGRTAHRVSKWAAGEHVVWCWLLPEAQRMLLTCGLPEGGASIFPVPCSSSKCRSTSEALSLENLTLVTMEQSPKCQKLLGNAWATMHPPVGTKDAFQREV